MAEAGRKGIPVGWGFLAGAAIVTFLFYREFILQAGSLLAGSDMLIEGYPLRKFYVDEIRSGRGIPLWTPHVYGGMPYVALLPGPIFYPTTLLYFLMPLSRAIGWTFVLHTFLSGAFAYFMARSFRLRPWSAAVTGVCFLLTGYVTSHLFGGQDGRMFAMTLMPLALGCLERALRSGETRWYCGLALAVGLQVFTPHTQIVYFSALALSLYLVFHLVVRVRLSDTGREGAGGSWRRYATPAGAFAIAFLGAGCLGAIQLLPTFALLDHVTRSAAETGYEFAASWALPPQEITALFLPDLIGSVQTYWGSNPLKLHSEYLGSVPIALAMLAIAASVRPTLAREQRWVVWFLAGASALGILFALGATTPVHRIAVALLPLMSSFRAPAMMMSAVALFVCLLAGYGWESALEAREGEGKAPSEESGKRAGKREAEVETRRFFFSPVWLGVLAAPVLLLSLAAAVNAGGLLRWARLAWFEPGWPRLPSEALQDSLSMTGLIVLAGFAVAWAAAWLVARRRLAPIAVLAVLVFTVADLWRIGDRYLPVRGAEFEWVEDPLIERLLAEAEPGERTWAAEGTYGANALMYWGLPSPVGTQKFQLEPYARLVGSVRAEEGFLRNPALMPFFRIAFLITASPQPSITPLLEAAGARLYRIPSPPHAYFPAEVRGLADIEEAVAVTRQNPDPLGLAVVSTVAGSAAPPAGQGSARITRYEPEVIELEVQVEQGGLLAVSEVFHPGWTARVDGVETRIWQTNVAFRGVEVPAGSHRVRFEYRSAAFTAGRLVSLAASLMVVALLLASWYRGRGARPHG